MDKSPCLHWEDDPTFGVNNHLSFVGYSIQFKNKEVNHEGIEGHKNGEVGS